MAKFVLICGPQAVGKMTVGQELAKITQLKFMHNHETIDLPLKFFPYKSEARKRLTDLFRFFTVLFEFDKEENWDWLEKIKNIYEKENGEFYIVELESTLEERLRRNKTENRLKNKPTKRDIESSEKELLSCSEEHRLNSYEGEVKYKNYLRIDNTNISAEDTAKMIKEKFNF